MLCHHGQLGLARGAEGSQSPTRSESLQSSNALLVRDAGMVMSHQSWDLSDFLSKYLPVSCSLSSYHLVLVQAQAPPPTSARAQEGS